MNSDGWHRVHEALGDSRWDFRTVDSIARHTGLSPHVSERRAHASPKPNQASPRSRRHVGLHLRSLAQGNGANFSPRFIRSPPVRCGCASRPRWGSNPTPSARNWRGQGGERWVRSRGCASGAASQGHRRRAHRRGRAGRRERRPRHHRLHRRSLRLRWPEAPLQPRLGEAQHLGVRPGRCAHERDGVGLEHPESLHSRHLAPRLSEVSRKPGCSNRDSGWC